MKNHAGVSYQGRRQNSRAFTMVELLVAVAILLVLAAITFTVSRRMIEAAHRADAVSDLRALSVFATAGAHENLGRFALLHKDRSNPHHFNKRNPDNPAADQSLVTLEDLIEQGLTQDTAFCMANKRWSKMADYYWYEFQGGRAAVFSYAYLANDNGWADDNSRFSRPTDGRALLFGRNLDSMPATPKTITDDRVWYPYIWADVCRKIGDDFLANFMTTDGKVKGVNVVHVDGRVEWKEASDVKQRYTTSGMTFYW